MSLDISRSFLKACWSLLGSKAHVPGNIYRGDSINGLDLEGVRMGTASLGGRHYQQMNSWHRQPGVQPAGRDWPHPGSLRSLLGCIYPRQSLGNIMSSWPGARSLSLEQGLAAACLLCSLPVVLAMTHTVYRHCGACSRHLFPFKPLPVLCPQQDMPFPFPPTRIHHLFLIL